MERRPIVLVVDDDPIALAALRDALLRRYANDYEISAFRSPLAALDELASLADNGDHVALVVADQWMPELPGVELLARVRELAPEAQRGLLVEWHDRTASGAILQGCAFGKLHNYLRKPSVPPEVHLYPDVNAFLAEWMRGRGQHIEIMKIVGRSPSRRMQQLHELFERNGLPHGVYEIDSPAGRRLVEERGLPTDRLPVVHLLDGTTLIDPSNKELADELGSTELFEGVCDLAIIGGGPAGLAAAVYASSEGLRTTVVEREVVGGQAGTSTLIRNYLGFPRGVTGAELAQRAWEQAWLFGTRYLLAHEVLSLREDEEGLRVITLTGGRELAARAVVIATGARYRRIGVESLERLVDAGVYYTSFGDGRLLRGREAFVVGGGNSAGQAVAHLAESGVKKVTLLVRGAALEQGMSDYLVQQLRQAPNVEIRLNTEVVDGGGDTQLEWIEVRDRRSGATERMPASMLFLLIGAVPHTDWLAGTVERDAKGFILTGRDLSPARPRFETSLPGVFAVGDVRAGSVKRVASAVGEGAMVVPSVHEYLSPPRVAPRRPVSVAATEAIRVPAP